MNWSDVLKAVIPIVVMSLAWLLGQVNSFSERLTDRKSTRLNSSHT